MATQNLTRHHHGGPGSGGGGGGGGSGGGGGGGGGGTGGFGTVTSTRKWQEYADYAFSIGIGNSPWMLALAHQAAGAGWSVSAFEYELYQSAGFKKEFPGIMTKNGGLLMSPRVYNDEYRAYQGTAAIYGYHLSRQQFGTLVKNNVNTKQFETRVQAVNIFQHNRPDFMAFRDTLQAQGIKSKVTTTDLLKWIMGQGDKRWNAVWDEAAMRSAAATTGVAVGTDITRAQLMDLMRSDPTLEAQQGSVALLSGASKILNKAAQDYRDTALGAGLAMTGQQFGVSDFAKAEEGVGSANINIAIARAKKGAEAAANQAREKLGSGLDEQIGLTQQQVKAGVTSQEQTI